MALLVGIPATARRRLFRSKGTRQGVDAAGTQSKSARYSGKRFTRYIETLSPPGVQVKLTPMGASPASIMDYHIPAMKAAEAACRGYIRPKSRLCA